MLCHFKEFSHAQQGAAAGGKGRVLAQLSQAGYPVPDGFIILASAFNEQGLLSEQEPAVLAAYRTLCAGQASSTVAVRSSALAEDSAKASYAGEFETVLNIDSEAKLLQAIQTVFHSGHSERVQAYAAAQDQATTGQTLAVVVQRMLNPCYAGVLFTVDPVSGRRDVMQGNLTAGLGEALVSGTVTGEAFTFQGTAGQYDGPAAFQPYQARLFQLAQQLVETLQAPQDIEWAVADDTVFILQSRPITTLTPTNNPPETWNDSLNGSYLWCNTNLGELFGNVITPFTWSVFHEVVRRNVGPVGGHFMIGRLAGRAYFNISLIYSILHKMGKKRQDILGSFELFLGEIPDYVTIPTVAITWPNAIGFMFKQIKGSIKAGRQLKRFLAWAEHECPTWCNEQFTALDRCQSNAELIQCYQTIEPVIYDTFAMVTLVGNQFVQQQYKIKAALTDVLTPEEVAIILSGLDNNGQLASMAPLLGIAALQKGEISKADFIRRYGHRGPNEAEYAAPRTAEDPAWIEQLIQQWQDADPAHLLQQQKAKREQVWQRLRTEHPQHAQKLQPLFDAAISLAHNRELAKSENFRQGWVLRRWVERAAALNQQPADALFYLTESELLQLLHGETAVLQQIAPRRATYQAYAALPPIPSLICGAIDPFQWAQSPNRRTDYYAADAQSPTLVEDAGHLKGFPGSAGVVEGTVRVLASHQEMQEFISGEILVTSFTNVGWTPLFPRAAAIITDIGAPLSHAAIVARELGIPAVVGTGNATMKLKTGDRVRVNGSAGVVEVLSL